MSSLRDYVRRTFTKAPRRVRSASPRLKIEALETRQLLSTFSLSNAGVLTQGSTVIDQNVSSFETDSAGDLFELKTNGSLWLLPSGGAWTQLDMNVGSFNVNASGVLEEVKTNGNLWSESGGTWIKVAGNVSQGGIDNLGNVYYLTSAGGFDVWTSATGSTQINPSDDPVINFKMGGSGNEQVYYQYGIEPPTEGSSYAIYDWTDHNAANPYGISVGNTFFAAGLTQENSMEVIGQYAVGANGDLYATGGTRLPSGTILSTNKTNQTATVSLTTAASLYVGEAVFGGATNITSSSVSGSSIITSIASDVLHFQTGVTGTSNVPNPGVDFHDPVAMSDRLLEYVPGPTPAASSLFQAVDPTNGDVIKITNLVGSPDDQYLFFTGSSVPAGYLYFYRYQIGASTPLVQLDRIASTTGSAPTAYLALYDLQVGGDDSAYVLEVSATGTGSTGSVTNATLLGAAAGATTVTPIDDNVLLPTAAQVVASRSGPTTYAPYTVAPNGNVIVLETGGKLIDYNVATSASGLVLDSAGATQIAVSSNGEFFEGKSNGNFWELTVNGSWTQLDTGGLSSFGTTPNGAVYELKTNGNFWNYVGGSGTASDSVGWTLISGGVSTFLLADGLNPNFSAAQGMETDSYAPVSLDGQVAYVATGAAYLLLPSQYNLNGSFEAVAAGAYALAYDNGPNTFEVVEVNGSTTLYV